MSTNLTRRKEIVSSLQDKEYRDLFVAEQINTGLAFQIRTLRDKRGWTQEELGRRTRKAQESISLFENPNYGRFTLTTLKQMASTFDVGLMVRFVPFSELVDWVSNLSHQDLAVPSFEEDTNLETTTIYMSQESLETVESHASVGIFASSFMLTSASAFVWNRVSTEQIVPEKPSTGISPVLKTAA